MPVAVGLCGSIEPSMASNLLNVKLNRFPIFEVDIDNKV